MSDNPANETPTQTRRPTFLHASSGALILGLDWLLFSGTAVTAGLAAPLTAALGFVLGSISTVICQRFAARDTWVASLGKGVLAGVAVGVPFPILGTFVGGLVLASSGLSSVKKLLPKD